MNPYQRIIKDGVVIQEGQMDTPTKFKQLTDGVDLKGKLVLDIGCNLGMMCHLAKEAGALYAKGIDINRDYIKEAREVFPTIEFECTKFIAGNFDIIIASAMLHYINDLDKFFKQLARCGKKVLCDVWLNDSPDNIFLLTHRDIYIPSRSAFLHIVGKHFKKIKEKGLALTPDGSKRYIFHLSKPKSTRPEAVLIYGDGLTGKTTLAMTYFGYQFLGTDGISTNWRFENKENLESIAWFTKIVRGQIYQEYIDYHLKWFDGWIKNVKNLDIVIEGYDLVYEDLRGEIIKRLIDWDVKEIKLEVGYNSPLPIQRSGA